MYGDLHSAKVRKKGNKTLKASLKESRERVTIEHALWQAMTPLFDTNWEPDSFGLFFFGVFWQVLPPRVLLQDCAPLSDEFASAYVPLSVPSWKAGA